MTLSSSSPPTLLCGVLSVGEAVVVSVAVTVVAVSATVVIVLVIEVSVVVVSVTVIDVAVVVVVETVTVSVVVETVVEVEVGVGHEAMSPQQQILKPATLLKASHTPAPEELNLHTLSASKHFGANVMSGSSSKTVMDTFSKLATN